MRPSLSSHPTGAPLVRYDRLCMLPENEAAHRGIDSLHRALDEARVVEFLWTPMSVLVIDNWIAFHGRGPCLDVDQGRIIERMTVGGSLT